SNPVRRFHPRARVSAPIDGASKILIRFPTCSSPRPPGCAWLVGALASDELVLHGLAHKIRPVLPVLEHALDPRKCALLEPRLHVFGPASFASHDFFLI